MEEVFFHEGNLKEANRLVRRWHYSHRSIPKQTVFLVGTWHLAGGFFGTGGEAVAACILSRTTAPTWKNVIELVRLVRVEGISLPPLTLLISQTLRVARVAGIDLVVSFADSTQGHHGGIYQAASFSYSGMRAARADGIVVKGSFIPYRSLNHKIGTQNAEFLKSRGLEFERHFDTGKHLYWKALNRRGKKQAQDLGLVSMAYPKSRSKSLK